MARRLDLGRAPAYRPDDNAATYRADEDGRNASGERVRYVPLRLIHPSRHQTRRLTDPDADALLADDIDAAGLVQYPVVRPHPDRPGEFEAAVGHRRLAALRRLAREGRGARVLRGSADDPEDMRAPVVVRELDDVAAHSMTVAENLVREDLRPWEQACALEELARSVEAQGDNATVRGLARHLDVSHQTIAPYLRVARRLTPDVLKAAGLVRGDDDGSEPVVDESALCRLSLAALERAARPRDVETRARVLRAELSKTVGSARGHERRMAEARDAGGTEPTDARARGLQVNIRRPLGTLTRDEARRHLDRLAPAVAALVEAACGTDDSLRAALPGGRLLVLRIAADKADTPRL